MTRADRQPRIDARTISGRQGCGGFSMPLSIAKEKKKKGGGRKRRRKREMGRIKEIVGLLRRGFD